MAKLHTVGRNFFHRGLWSVVDAAIVRRPTRLALCRSYSLENDREQQAITKSKCLVVEGDVTYSVDSCDRSLFLDESGIFKRNMTVSMLRTLVNLNKRHSRRKYTVPLVDQQFHVNTHITGLKIGRILNISDTSDNGLALIRCAVEVPELTEIVVVQNVNDPSFQENMESNNCKDKVHILHREGVRDSVEDLLGDEHQNIYDAVLIDSTKFSTKAINSAFNCIQDGGVISFSVPSFNYRSKGRRLDAPYNPELALRMCLHMLHHSAMKFDAKMLPLLCYNYNGMLQLFVRVFYSYENYLGQFPDKTGSVHHCPECSNFIVSYEKQLLPSCMECGSALQVSGMLWTSPYADAKMTNAIYGDVKKHYKRHLIGESMIYLLSYLEQEVADALFFHDALRYQTMFRFQRPLPTNLFMSALENMGYSASFTHMKTGCVKTFAPPEVVLDVLRKWAEIFPERDMHKTSAVHSKIIDKRPQRVVDFFVNINVNKRLRRLRDRTRFQVGKVN